MRLLIARLFRFLFRFSFFEKRFYGIHQRLFEPYKLYKGVVENVTLSNGLLFELHIDDWIQENIYFLGRYEEGEISFIKSKLKLGDTFLDIGANIGLHTLTAAETVGRDGRVISFEPFATNYNRLCQNIFMNDFKNIDAVNKAVSDSNKWIDLFYNKAEHNLGMVSSINSKGSLLEKVEAVSIDSFVNEQQFSSIDFVKLDIEGAELSALKGMKNTLEKHHPILLVEILLEDNTENRDQIFDYLLGFGYKNYLLDEGGHIFPYNQTANDINHVFI